MGVCVYTLILSGKKALPKTELIGELHFKDELYKQYKGVFSSDHIDYASQFLLEKIKPDPNARKILDLASGNGVLAKEVSKEIEDAEYHLVDDSILAVASAELNFSGSKVHHHWDNSLEAFPDESFDLIISNPPFHFEYEVNINITLDLFKQAHRCLRSGGELWVVANKHLNYGKHLKELYSRVESSSNEKFSVCKAVK